MFDILSIGHATIDFFWGLDPKTVPVVWSNRRKDSYVCLDFADKTPARSISWSLGGNAVNSGLGLARLGVNAALLTEVGDDEWGQLVRRELSKESLNLDFFKISPGKVTDLSAILTLKGERTIISYHHPRAYELPKNFPQTKWVYLTSLGAKFSTFHRGLIALLDRESVQLAYNPGTYELLAGIEVNREIIRKTAVLIVNREEAGELVGRKPMVVDNNLLKELGQLGAGIVVITDGKNGSFAYDQERFYHQGIYPVKRVEMTGAGDSFSAGFLAALIYQKDLSEALKWGTINSASVIQHVGSTKGLLTREALEKRLEKSRTLDF